MKKLVALILSICFLLSYANTVFSYNLSNGLMAKYKFNSTDTLNDSYGDYEPLVNVSAPALATGIVEKGAFFSNALSGTQKLKYNNSAFKLTTFTYNAWIFPNGFGDLGHTIIDNSYFSGGFYSGSVFSARGNGSLQAWIFTGDGLTNYCLVIAGSGVNKQVWSMVTEVFDDTNNWLAFYVNGSLISNNTCSFSANYTSYAGFSVGSSITTGTSASYNGTIDEVAIWNRALSTSEILAIFDVEKTGVGFESNFSGGESPLTNTISILTPTNLSYSFLTANVSISTSLNSTCKYSTAPFEYTTSGTLFSTTGNTDHYLLLNVTDATYTYYYACNSTAGITNSSQHSFYGKTKNWANTFLSAGDSVVGATPYVTATQRFTYLIPTFLTANGFYGITENNQGVDATCCSDFGNCATKNPLVLRVGTTIIQQNARFSHVLPCVNDQYWNVTVDAWKSAMNSIFDNVRANGTNTTLILSSSTLVLYDTTNYLSNAKQADYDSKIREYAILHNVPYAEVHYAFYDNQSYLYDTAHLSVEGHKKVNESISTIIQSQWTMNTSNYNIYHDCNNSITVLNTTLSMPTANCDDRNGLADWLILKNISALSILVERADKTFTLNLSGHTPSTYYNVTINNGSLYSTLYLSNSTGGINNIALPTGTNYNILLGESTPIINIVSPANNTRSNQPLDVVFNISNYASSVSCSLYINGSLNTTNSTVIPDTQTHLIADLTNLNIFIWYVNCSFLTGNIVSNIYTYPFDNSQPFIIWNMPSYYNTTIVDTNVLVLILVTDDYLYRVNATIFAPNGSILYNNYSGDLTNGTISYFINENISTTSLPQGNYTIVMEAADSHTGNTFEIVDSIQEMPEESKYKIQLAKDAPEFVVSDGLAMDFVQQQDRISFVITADRAERKSFTFKTEEPLIEIKNSQYPCHYVFGKYWFDCEGLENPSATLLNENELLVEFDVIAEPKSEIIQGEMIAKTVFGEGKIEAGSEELIVSMKSLGGLNENREVATFEVDHCDPVWTCDSYSACNEYGQQVCNHTTDVALCGYNYTGDYSELTQQVCTDDVFAYWDMELNNANWFRDMSGNNRQLICLKEGGTDCSDLQQADGLIGNAAGDFANGALGVINTSMSTPVVNALNQNTSFSIVMWVNVKQYDLSNKTLFYAHNYNNINGTMDIELQYEQQQSNWKFGLRTFLNNSNAAWTFAEGYHLATVNNWNMIVATFDTDTNTMSLYINNQLIDTAQFTDSIASQSYAIYTLGRDGVYGTHGASNVWIDETGIYTKALTTTEIETLSNRGLGCTYPFTSCPSMFNYATEDLPSIIFDMLGTAGAVFISFIPFIIILGLIIVVIKYYKKHKR